MSQPTIEHVYAAIDALYHTQQVEGTEAASKWLDEFQRSQHAWDLSNQLLKQNRDPESTYLAAQTMKTKIQYHFTELPIDQHLGLRDSLIEHLLQYSLSSHATLTQLCLALADLAIQCPQWKTPVNDLVQKFSSKLEHFSILLEILMIMPEEVESEILRIGANRRKEVSDSFKTSSEVVFNLLIKAHEVCPADDRTQCKLYQCFGSWLTVGCFPSQEVANSSLLKLAFETLLKESISSQLHDAITDCICNALYTSGDLQNQMPLAEACFNFVSTTVPPAFEKATKEEDMDKAINYSRIYAEMGEAFLECILCSPGQGPGNLKTMDLILDAVAHPDYEFLLPFVDVKDAVLNLTRYSVSDVYKVSEISFNFWYRLSEYIDANTPEEMRHLFKPYVQRLIFELCKSCQFEATQEGVPDKGDEFQDFRLRCLDVIHDVVFIIGSSECFKQIFLSIQNETEWNKLESRIFALNPMSKFIRGDDPTPGFLLQMMLNLSQDMHIMVRHTCVVLIGDLASWVSDHSEFVDGAFQFILNSLQHKELAQMGAFALAKFCSSNSHKMNKMFPILLEVSKAVDSLGIDNEGVIAILTGCAVVLSGMPPSHVTDGLMHLCTPHVQPLYEIIKATGATDPVRYLDRLACIFRNMQVIVESGEHPCKKVITQLWDLFKLVIDKYKTDDRVMERHFRCIRFGIRCIGKDFMDLMEPLVELMVNLYAEHPLSCLLYIGSVLVDEYGNSKQAEKVLMQMLKSFVQPTFQILSKERGLFYHPDTVDDFFRLCIRCMQQCTLSFLKNDSMDSIVQLAVAGTTLDHRDANLSVMKFLVELVKCTYVEQSRPEFHEVRERVSMVEGLLGKYGQDIVKGMVTACAGGIQPFMLPDVADVLWEMIQFCQMPTLLWFKNALSTLPSHNPSGSINATPEQIENFYNVVANATTVKVLWKEFRDFSKYFK